MPTGGVLSAPLTWRFFKEETLRKTSDSLPHLPTFPYPSHATALPLTHILRYNTPHFAFAVVLPLNLLSSLPRCRPRNSLKIRDFLPFLLAPDSQIAQKVSRNAREIEVLTSFTVVLLPFLWLCESYAHRGCALCSADLAIF